MTVASAANKVTLNGNGATTSWPFSFRIFDSSDLEIYKTDTSGVQTEITSNFSVVVNGESGGTVTYPSTGSPLASGETITIIRVTVRAQSVDFTSQGAFLPQNHEDADDRAMMILQELDEKIDRAFKLPTSDTSGTATELTTDVTGSAGGVLYIQSGVLKLSDSANIDDLETLAGISGDITTVAANDANITTVADNLNGTDTIGTVAGSIANVNNVGNNISNVVAVGGNETNINAAVANATNINTVAGISADVTTVAGISADVTAVAADAADIGVVSSNVADVNAVAGISVDVTTVATDSAAINIVATDLAGDDDTGTVAANISNVNAVGSNISDITNAVSQAAAGVQRNTYTGDNSTVTFVLPATPWDADVVFAYLDGVNQDNSEWSISGSDITFNTAPGTGVNIELVVLTAGTVTAAQTSASNAAASEANAAASAASAAAAANEIGLVDTIAELQALTGGVNDVVTVRGRAASGDGGGGVYRWDGSNLSTEVSADEMTASAGDGGVYVAPSSDQTGASGAWVLDVKAEMYAGVYGLSASATGTVNQTALQNAITRAQALGVRLNIDVGGTVTIDTGKVTISDDLYLFSTHDTIFFTASGMNDHTFEVNGSGADVVIEGVRTDGNRAANPTSNKSAFYIVAADHVLLKNTRSTDHRYGNIYVNPTGVIKSVRALDTHHVAAYGGYFCYGDGSNYVECQEIRGGYWYDFITEAIDFNGTNHPEVNVDISAKRFQTGGALAGNDEGVDVEGVKSGIINVVLDCDGQARTGIRFKGASEKIIANCVVSNAKSTTLTNEASTDITTDWDITDSAISDVGGNRIDWDGTQTTTATATQTGSTLTADAYYVVRYQVSNMTAGSVTVKLGTASGSARTDNGEYFESIVASSGSPQLALEGDADFDGRIDLDFFLLYEDGSAGVVIGGLSDSIINASVDGCWAGLCCNSTGGSPTGVICNVRSDTHTFAGVYSYATLDYCDFNLNVDGDGYAGFVGDYLQRTRIQGAITEGGGTSTQKIDVCGGLRALIGPINFGSGAQTGRIDVGDDTDDGGSRVTNIMIADSRGFRMENWGEASVSPDANGEFTISHLVRRTPTFATLRIKGDNTDHADVVSISSSNITGRIKDSSGADVTSGTYDVLWEARAVREIGA